MLHLPAPSFWQLVRHAELYGTECVWDAASHLDTRSRGQLAMRLRGVDPRWSLPRRLRASLAHELLAAQVPVRDVQRMTGLGRSRVYEIEALRSPRSTERRRMTNDPRTPRNRTNAPHV